MFYVFKTICIYIYMCILYIKIIYILFSFSYIYICTYILVILIPSCMLKPGPELSRFLVFKGEDGAVRISQQKDLQILKTTRLQASLGR